MKVGNLTLLLTAIALYFSAPVSSSDSSFTCHGENANSSFVGLRPDPDDCRKFWHCRKVNPENRIGYLFAQESFNDAVRRSVPASKFYKCSDWNSSKPYFNAETCECVETEDHCSNNEKFKENCSRGPLNVGNEKVELEPCRHWGQNGTYYLGLFPDYDFPDRFWQCAPGEQEPAYAVSQPCPAGSLAKPPIVYSQEKCECVDSHDIDETMRDRIQHPMYRENCVEKYLLCSGDNCKV